VAVSALLGSGGMLVAGDGRTRAQPGLGPVAV